MRASEGDAAARSRAGSGYWISLGMAEICYEAFEMTMRGQCTWWSGMGSLRGCLKGPSRQS